MEEHNTIMSRFIEFSIKEKGKGNILLEEDFCKPM